MISIGVAVLLILLVALVHFLVVEGRVNNPSHLEFLLKAELLIQAFGRLILVPNDDERHVAAFNHQTGEVLCQVNAVAKNK